MKIWKVKPKNTLEVWRWRFHILVFQLHFQYIILVIFYFLFFSLSGSLTKLDVIIKCPRKGSFIYYSKKIGFLSLFFSLRCGWIFTTVPNLERWVVELIVYRYCWYTPGQKKKSLSLPPFPKVVRLINTAHIEIITISPLERFSFLLRCKELSRIVLFSATVFANIYRLGDYYYDLSVYAWTWI